MTWEFATCDTEIGTETRQLGCAEASSLGATGYAVLALAETQQKLGKKAIMEAL